MISNDSLSSKTTYLRFSVTHFFSVLSSGVVNSAITAWSSAFAALAVRACLAASAEEESCLPVLGLIVLELPFIATSASLIVAPV